MNGRRNIFTHLLPHLNPDWFNLCGTGLPRLSSKRRRKTGVVVVAGALIRLSTAMLSLVCQVDASSSSVAHMLVSVGHMHSVFRAWLSQDVQRDQRKVFAWL